MTYGLQTVVVTCVSMTYNRLDHLCVNVWMSVVVASFHFNCVFRLLIVSAVCVAENLIQIQDHCSKQRFHFQSVSIINNTGWVTKAFPIVVSSQMEESESRMVLTSDIY
uniref:PPUP8477 n=1 Tax=Poeciliopsis prolifica TaxID=188132 RepID=A0A0S7ETX7_9TELE